MHVHVYVLYVIYPLHCATELTVWLQNAIQVALDNESRGLPVSLTCDCYSCTGGLCTTLNAHWQDCEVLSKVICIGVISTVEEWRIYLHQTREKTMTFVFYKYGMWILCDFVYAMLYCGTSACIKDTLGPWKFYTEVSFVQRLNYTQKY